MPRQLPKVPKLRSFEILYLIYSHLPRPELVARMDASVSAALLISDIV